MYKQNSQKKYGCDYCAKKFLTRSARNNHERKHTEYYSSESSSDLVENLQAEELPSVSQDVDMRETEYKDMLVDTPFSHQRSVYKHFSKADKERPNNNKPERKEVDEDNYAPEQDESVQEIEEDNEQEESAQEMEESVQEMEEIVREMEGAQETEEEIGQDSSEEMNSHEVRKNLILIFD